MSRGNRTEVICGLIAGGWGLLLVLGAYFQPYGDSKCSSEWLCLHPGFTPIEYPYLAAFGIPLLGIVLGAIADGVHPSVPARLVLVVATVIFTGEALISIASIGLLLLPAAALGIAASIMSLFPEKNRAA
jgi:hypothetical protein